MAGVPHAIALMPALFLDVAGPEPLVENVVRVCAAHNQRVGLTGSPWLDACKYTFSL